MEKHSAGKKKTQSKKKSSWGRILLGFLIVVIVMLTGIDSICILADI